MSEREYIVSLNRGVDHVAFNQEMIASTGAGVIPERTVEVADARATNIRNTHYNLTDAEADTLRTDTRVYAVTLKDDPNLHIGFDAIQKGDFTKTTLDRGNFLNWGMRRMNEATNPYTGVSASAGGYNYTLDGTGIDVVIVDSGIQADHPEFQDAAGASRVQQIDWFTASGVAGTMPTAHYTDYDGHGTHVAGTVAGKTYGWAKNAKIYSIKLLPGPTDPNVGMSETAMADVIIAWHNAKPNDATTGYKRPTIVNHSWGYGIRYNTVNNLTYRSAVKTGTDIDTSVKRNAFGLYPYLDSSASFTYSSPVRKPSLDIDIDLMIEAGIHVVVAAGNRSHKIDIPGGDDYNNYFQAVNAGTAYYYNRGSSPLGGTGPTDGASGADDILTVAHIVGSTDSTIHSGGLEQKATYSETGPGVSIYAPGTNIMSAMSTTNKFSATIADNPYPGNAAFLINNISGTSMASPQVAGMLALWIQINPNATPAQGLAFVNSTSKTAKLYDTASSVDYADTRSLLGSTNRFAFNKFNSNVQMRIGAPAVAAEEAAAATYSLSTSSAAANEGSAFTITLTTTNIDDATVIPYTITGVASADIGGVNLSGNFTVSSNTATASFNVTADATTEGAETFLLSLDALSVTQSVTINDTSLTPAASPTYAVAPAAGSVNEGSALVFNVTTANIANATTLYWSVTSASDFSTSTGSFTITSDAGTFSVTPTADSATEGAETFTASVRTVSVSGTIVATSSAVTINDTSTAGASYALAASQSTITEGESTTITLTTANVADATNVPYTISGVTQADLDEGPLTSTAIKDFEGPGGALFKRELTTNYLRIIAAGAVGGQTAVPDDWLLKTGRMAQLFLNRTGSNIVTADQDQVRANLKGGTTSWHPNSQAIQRVARGGGGSYTPNFLADDGSSAWGLYQLYQTTQADDMVWYLNSSSSRPQVGDDDAAEIMEHILHTLCMKGLDNPSMKFDASVEAGWATGPTFLAIQQAVNASKFDPSGYGANWATQADHFTVAAKEYLYLLTFGMFEYTSLWDGSSLSPEWTDDMRTPAGIQTNNALGYALFNTYMKPVFDNPSLATIRNMFQNGDNGDPTAAGANGYVASTAISLTGNFTIASNTSAVTLNVAADGVSDSDALSLSLDNAAAAQAITVNDNGVTPGFKPDYTLYVTNPGGNAYTLLGRDRNGAISAGQPALAFNNGDKVLFTVNSSTSSSHPFYVKTVQGTGTGNQAAGVTGNGTVNVEWTIGSAGTFYYQCSIHGGMNNTITAS